MGVTDLLTFSGAGIAKGAYNAIRTGDPSHFYEDAGSISGIKGIVAALAKITGLPAGFINGLILGGLGLLTIFALSSIHSLV